MLELYSAESTVKKTEKKEIKSRAIKQRVSDKLS